LDDTRVTHEILLMSREGLTLITDEGEGRGGVCAKINLFAKNKNKN